MAKTQGEVTHHIHNDQDQVRAPHVYIKSQGDIQMTINFAMGFLAIRTVCQ